MNSPALNDKRMPTASLMMAMSGMAIANNAMSILMNEVIDEFGLVGTQEGLMNSTIYVGGLLAVIMVPFLQGRIRKPAIIAFSILLQAMALAITGIAPVFALLLLACVFLGVGGGWIDSNANACLIDIHKNGGARYMGMLHGFFGLGAILAPLIIQGMLFAISWRSVYLILGAVIFVNAIQFFIVYRRNKGIYTPAGAGGQRVTLRDFGGYFKNRRALLLTFCIFFYSCSQSALSNWMARYMKVQYSAEALGALAISIFWVACTLSRFFAPRLRATPLQLVLFGAATKAVLMAVGVLSGSPVLVVAMAAVSGLVSGHSIPMLIHESAVSYSGNSALPTSVAVFVIQTSMILVPLLSSTVGGFSMQGSMLLPSVFAALTFVLCLATIKTKAGAAAR